MLVSLVYNLKMAYRKWCLLNVAKNVYIESILHCFLNA